MPQRAGSNSLADKDVLAVAFGSKPATDGRFVNTRTSVPGAIERRARQLGLQFIYGAPAGPVMVRRVGRLYRIPYILAKNKTVAELLAEAGERYPLADVVRKRYRGLLRLTAGDALARLARGRWPKGAHTDALAGLLYGYPPCCVRFYITRERVLDSRIYKLARALLPPIRKIEARGAVPFVPCHRHAGMSHEEFYKFSQRAGPYNIFSPDPELLYGPLARISDPLSLLYRCHLSAIAPGRKKVVFGVLATGLGRTEMKAVIGELPEGATVTRGEAAIHVVPSLAGTQDAECVFGTDARIITPRPPKTI